MSVKRALTTFVLILTTLFFAAPSAMAHTGLESSTPKEGAALSAAPTEVVLNFDEELLENTVKVVAHLAGEKTNVLDDVAEANGKTVNVPWPQNLAGGTYEVAYRIVSADGHPVTGTLTFSYVTSSSSATTSPSPSASPSESPSTSPVETLTPSPSATPAATTSGTSPIVVIIIGLIIGIVIGLVIFFTAKKRT